MFLRKSLIGMTAIILAGGMAAFAEQPQTQTSIQTSTMSPDDNLSRDRIERRERRREEMGRRQKRRGHDGMGRHGSPGRLMQELNLSDEQRQQSRAIMQRRLEGTKTQREELLKLREKRRAGTFAAEDEARARALHQEIRAAMEGARSEMAGILTAEQKTKLEERIKEHKAGIEQRMKERQEYLKHNPR